MEFTTFGHPAPALYDTVMAHFPDELHLHDLYASDDDLSRLICADCYVMFVPSFTMDHDSPPHPCHHFHRTDTAGMINALSVRCCSCQQGVHIQIHQPPISSASIKFLKNEHKQNAFAALSIFLKLASNVLNGNMNPVRTNNKRFVEATGNSRATKLIMDSIGFQLDAEGAVWTPPSMETDEKTQRMDMVVFQLACAMQVVCVENGIPMEQKQFHSARSMFLSSCGVYAKRSLEYVSVHDPKAKMPYSPSYTVLGDMHDDVVAYVFHCAINHEPSRQNEFLEALDDLATGRRSSGLRKAGDIARARGMPEHGKVIGIGAYTSVDLQNAYIHYGTKMELHTPNDVLFTTYYAYMHENPGAVAEHRRQLRIIGRSRKSEEIAMFLERDVQQEEHTRQYVLEAPSVKPPSLRDAFNHFEVLLASSKQVDDQMLLALFEAKVNERPQDLDKHIASLTVIAENRTSTTLLDYIANLNKEPEVAEGMSLDDNSWIAVPSRGNLPVGLYNIGNTCYLNSLLQYYFSIRELRDKMIHYAPPATITLGNEQDKKGVSVYYAQHFTRLLGELYGHMTSSRDTALAPSTELAEMALLPANQVNTHKAQVDDGGVAPMDLSQSTHSNASGNGVIRIRNETDLATAPAEVARTPSSRFGKQEDVTECMDNVMQLLEMAFEEKKATGFPTRLFEGKMKQTLEYISTDKKQQVSAKEETFSHVIISVKEGDDVYKGMDEYFSSGEVVYDGVEAKRHVTITQLPPFLQIQLQRVQYDKEASRVFKSNAFVKLLPTIHMDRYLESNAVETQKRRHDVAHYEAQAAKWASNNQQLSPSGISLGQMARELAQFIQTDFGTEVASDSGIQSHQLTHLSTQLDDWDQLALQKSKEYAEKANSQFDDMNHIEYDLHAVFIHRGHASSGHYWIYIRDRLHKRWLKFNDSNVTEVDDVEVFQNRQGSHENPYLLIYVKADVADALVDAGGI